MRNLMTGVFLCRDSNLSPVSIGCLWRLGLPIVRKFSGNLPVRVEFNYIF